MIKMRRKQIIYFKSTFTFKVTDTHIFDKADGIKDLETRQSISGIGITINKLDEDKYIITTRTNSLKFAIMDYNFCRKAIIRNYGEIEKETIYGKYYVRNTEFWEPFKLEDDYLIPVDEWSRFDKIKVGE